MKEISIDATKARREFFRLLSEVRYGGRRIVIHRRVKPWPELWLERWE